MGVVDCYHGSTVNAHMKSGLMLVGWIAVSFLAAALGGLATSGSVRDWYPTIAKPGWTPPSWVFGPVWTLLYISMGVAAWLVWNSADADGRRIALAVFFVQLVLNPLWSVIFFGWHRPGWAAVEIVMLWLAILGTVILFWKIRPLAGAILLPYLVWVSFAAVLNLAIWNLNR
jgi:tryptophan-rich sensory protein